MPRNGSGGFSLDGSRNLRGAASGFRCNREHAGRIERGVQLRATPAWGAGCGVKRGGKTARRDAFPKTGQRQIDFARCFVCGQKWINIDVVHGRLRLINQSRLTLLPGGRAFGEMGVLGRFPQTPALMRSGLFGRLDKFYNAVPWGRH